MVRDWLPTLFKQSPLVYSCWLAGRRYATQWTLPDSDAAGSGYTFKLLLEIDSSAIGLGGPPLRQRSWLVVDEFLRPLSYASEANETSWRLAFKEHTVTVELRNGVTKEVPRGDAEFASDPNMPGQTALLFAEVMSRNRLEREDSLIVFDVKQITPAPYRITRGTVAAGRSVITTSHYEEITLDRFVMQKYAFPKRSMEARLEPEPPPLPDWHDSESLTRPAAKYTPPKGRTFALEDVTIPGPITPLGGTLTKPGKPFAAALFIAGSGSHDRHGIAGALDIGSHEIMDHLAEHGVLGLRFDSRGAGNTMLGDDALEYGLDGVVADTRACLQFLRHRAEGLPVFLIGHSQGGTVALVLANEDGAAMAGVVLMAAPGRRIDEVIADQIAFQGRQIGLDDAQIAGQKHELEELVRIIEEDRSWEPEKIPDYLFAAVRARHWFKQQLARSPVELVRSLRCPVLICQGEKDFQISPQQDAQRLVDAARSAGVNFNYKLFPKLDHLFKNEPGRSNMMAYFSGERHIDIEVLTVIEQWIRSHTPVHG